jgi:poly-gamma-glutamate synthesis protein (capsule biosynthesis protein)
MCRYFAEQGASAIFIHHSHVVSGFELHNGVPIFYGLGNLVPGKIVTFDCLYSYSVMLEIEPESKSVFFTGYHAKWDQDESRVVLLTGDELLIAEQEQQRLNRIIGSEDQNAIAEALHMEFLTRERESSYFTALTRSSQLMFRIAKKARMINAYHRFIVRRMRLNRRNSTLWNMLRCETHRDVFDLIYNKHIDTYKNQ